MTDLPRTPASTLRRARDVARRCGIRYCYVGNVHDAEGQTTFCPNCRRALIERDWHAIVSYRLDGDRCPDCGNVIPGVFHAGDHSADAWRTGGGRWRVSLH
jgi:pyruvate formate lyase activating enzyme